MGITDVVAVQLVVLASASIGYCPKLPIALSKHNFGVDRHSRGGGNDNPLF